MSETKTSKYTGVTWHNTSNKWQARIQHGGKMRWLGTFDDEEDAHKAFQDAKVIRDNEKRLKITKTPMDRNGYKFSTFERTCLELRIPKSGNPELDALILESERKRIAVEAMGGVLASNTDEEMIDEGVVIHCSLSYTDELLKQLGYV